MSQTFDISKFAYWAKQKSMFDFSVDLLFKDGLQVSIQQKFATGGD